MPSSARTPMPQQLDLHGWTWDRAQPLVYRALAAASAAAYALTIITGVGKHSAAGGAVLRPRVAALPAAPCLRRADSGDSSSTPRAVEATR